MMDFMSNKYTTMTISTRYFHVEYCLKTQNNQERIKTKKYKTGLLSERTKVNGMNKHLT